MGKGYWVVNVETSDPVAYGAYVAFVGPYLASRGATFLTRRGQRVVKEGNARQRTVVVEFPSFAEAVAAYDDPAYQEGASSARRSVRLTSRSSNASDERN